MATFHRIEFLPEFSSYQPEMFFKLFERNMELLEITDPELITYYVLKVIPQQIAGLAMDPLFSKLNEIPEAEKYDYLKKFTIRECEYIKEDPFRAAMKLKMESDDTYVQFLTRLKSRTQTCENPKGLIESVFTQNIACDMDYKIAKAKIFEGNSIESIAEMLDQISNFEINATKNTHRTTTTDDIIKEVEKLNTICTKLTDELKKEREKTNMLIRKIQSHDERRTNRNTEHRTFSTRTLGQLAERTTSRKDNRPYTSTKYQPIRNYKNQNHFYENSVEEVCYYHDRFGGEAKRCKQPCKFNQTKNN